MLWPGARCRTSPVRALCFDGVLGLRERPIPEPANGQARVRVRLAGICGTDLQIVRGYAGHRGVLGHELVGDVEQHGDPSWIGRRVVAEINVGCGGCEACARGLRAHCATRRVIGIREHDGAFAPFVLVPHENLHVVPDRVDDHAAVFVEPLAAAFEILEQVALVGGSQVAVIGDGRLGLLVAMVLVDRGCDVTVVGRHPRKLAIAAGLGAHTKLGDDVRPRSHDCVVEATGAGDGFALAQRMIRPRGTIVVKSTTHGTTAVALAPIVVDEITVIGSRCGPFAPAIAALDRLDPRVLVDDVFALADGVRAFARAAEPGVLKVLLDMTGER
ncbi:MAG: alcohol dehydrogenase catalytic domain-containing protein [Deltaproteobacteria bacterium]|nr:alcohol dehydrogenase catalytic domain-containing protein [Nannocystaceae bacterium]